MRIGLLLGLLLSSLVARAQPIPVSGRTQAAFIPPGYKLLRDCRATGDLNGDGRADVVLALTSIEEDTTFHLSDNLPPRLLLVLWRTAGGYQLAAVARQLLLRNHSGINGDDPISSLAIQRGVLLVNYDVGGNCGYSTTAKFRYQKGGFYLIGERDIICSHRPDCDKLPYPPGYHYRDTNYLTGDYEIIKTSDECLLLQHKRGRQPVRPLRKLVNYKPVP